MTTTKQREAAIGRHGLAAVRPPTVEVWIATLDTGGIAYSGREFMAVDYSRENAEQALLAAVKADGWPEEIERDDPKTVEVLNGWYGIHVEGPIAIGTGRRTE